MIVYKENVNGEIPVTIQEIFTAINQDNIRFTSVDVDTSVLLGILIDEMKNRDYKCIKKLVEYYVKQLAYVKEGYNKTYVYHLLLESMYTYETMYMTKETESSYLSFNTNLQIMRLCGSYIDNRV